MAQADVFIVDLEDIHDENAETLDGTVIFAATQFVSQIQSVVSRELNAVESSGVASVTEFRVGGTHS